VWQDDEGGVGRTSAVVVVFLLVVVVVAFLLVVVFVVVVVRFVVVVVVVRFVVVVGGFVDVAVLTAMDDVVGVSETRVYDGVVETRLYEGLLDFLLAVVVLLLLGALDEDDEREVEETVLEREVEESAQEWELEEELDASDLLDVTADVLEVGAGFVGVLEAPLCVRVFLGFGIHLPTTSSVTFLRVAPTPASPLLTSVSFAAHNATSTTASCAAIAARWTKEESCPEEEEKTLWTPAAGPCCRARGGRAPRVEGSATTRATTRWRGSIEFRCEKSRR
jgi:hypothetical protein